MIVTATSQDKELLDMVEDAMMRVAMGVQKAKFLPADVHQEAVDLAKDILQDHQEHARKARIDELTAVIGFLEKHGRYVPNEFKERRVDLGLQSHPTKESKV